MKKNSFIIRTGVETAFVLLSPFLIGAVLFFIDSLITDIEKPIYEIFKSLGIVTLPSVFLIFLSPGLIFIWSSKREEKQKAKFTIIYFVLTMPIAIGAFAAYFYVKMFTRSF